MMTPLSPSVLPAGVRSRFIHDVNGITFHALEAGFETPGRQLVLLLHGFPELAYSWRKVMAPLAAAGYHVVAPDVRGYGRSGGTEVKHSDDLRPFGSLNKINDMLALVSALGYRSVAGVFGHDQGSPLAGWLALTRPDVFKSVIMMSSPFRGAPEALPFNTVNVPAPVAPVVRIHEDLARLTPPRKYYMKYYTQADANDNMWHALIASEWEKLPRYYVMDLDKGMAESVASDMPSAQEIAACHWLPDHELSVYSEEYGRNGFQGGLQGYRIGGLDQELKIFAGRTIDVPSLFVGGKSDWGVYQTPGGLESVEQTLTTQYKGTVLVDGAGHWVQQEQPEKVSKIFIDFLAAALPH